MNSEINVLLLAAGLGTRLKPLTLKYPKPCVPFLNVPLGLYQFQYLNYLNISNLVVNTHHLPQQIKNLYQNQPYYKKEILFSDEKIKILGGAGALKKAESLMKTETPFLLMNADEVYFTKQKDFLKTAFAKHLANKNLATVVVIQHPEAGQKFGAVWADQNNVVKDISKSARHAHLKPWHAIGPIFLSKEVLALIPNDTESNIFYDILLKKLAENKVQIFPIEADWYETGNPKDYLEATKQVLQNAKTDVLDFINQFDDSVLIKNKQTLSLVSKSFKTDYSKLHGHNVISKSSRLSVDNKIENTISFDSEILDNAFFSDL